MTSRPIPDHGTEARYQGAMGRPGCRCRRCIAGWTRAGKKRQLAALQGKPATIPAKPVTAHIQQLYASTMTTAQIANAANISASTIIDHAHGRFPAIRRTTADRILAVQPGKHGNIGRVPATGTRRRLRALYAIGHGPHLLAKPAGMSANGIANIAEGRYDYVTVATRTTVARLYNTLSGTPGTSTRAKKAATRRSWADPLWWEDMGGIDDPDAPENEQALDRRTRAEAVAEEVRHLAAFGISTHEIAARVGRSESYIRAQLTGDRRPGWRNNLQEAA